jgi:hypothetical protein
MKYLLPIIALSCSLLAISVVSYAAYLTVADSAFWAIAFFGVLPISVLCVLVTSAAFSAVKDY